MKLARALTSGLLGAAAAIVIFLAAHLALGREADASAIVGVWITSHDGALAWGVGAIAQLVIGAIVGALYAAAFEYVFRHAGPIAGLAVALPHVVIAGLAIGGLTAPPLVAAPLVVGAFLSFVGPAAVGAFIIAHAVFGAVAGVAYGRPLHAPSEPPVAWREITSGASNEAP